METKEELIKKGEVITYSRRQKSWEKFIENNTNNLDFCSDTVKIMESIEKNGVKVAYEDYDKLDYDREIYIMKNIIFNYSKKGPEFELYDRITSVGKGFLKVDDIVSTEYIETIRKQLKENERDRIYDEKNSKNKKLPISSLVKENPKEYLDIVDDKELDELPLETLEKIQNIQNEKEENLLKEKEELTKKEILIGSIKSSMVRVNELEKEVNQLRQEQNEKSANVQDNEHE